MATSCAEAKELVNTDFFGAWVLDLQGSAIPLALKRNPEFAESLAGSFMQGHVLHEVFGDIEAGVLDLEESNNGKDIIAIWKGSVVSGSCGKALTGTRWLVSTSTEQSFVLRRAGW